MSADEVVVPDVVGPISAFRAFRLAGDTRTGTWPVLAGVARRDTMWAPGPNRAVCLGHATGDGPTHHDEVPCRPDELRGAPGCGFYGVTHAVMLAELQAIPRVVTGRVLLWGRVFPHEFGYRAEHAQVVQLFVPRADVVDRAVVERLAEHYGAELTPFPVATGSPAERAALRAMRAERIRRTQAMLEQRRLDALREARRRPIDTWRFTRDDPPDGRCDGLDEGEAA